MIHGSEKNLVANFDASKSDYLGDNASGEFVLAEITPPAEDPTKAIVVEGSMTFYRSTLMLGYEIAPDKWSSEPMKGVLGTKDELRIGQSWEEGVVLKYKWRKGETRPALRFFDVPAGDYYIVQR